MKTRLVSVFLTMIVAVLTFAFAPRLAAQNGVQRRHSRYKLIDMGAFGRSSEQRDSSPEQTRGDGGWFSDFGSCSSDHQRLR